MNQNMEEYFEKTPDSVKSSENADLDMEKLRNLYHKNTDIKTKEQKLFEYANTVANVGLHQEWAHTVNPKEKALETNRKEIEFLTKATDAIKKDITKIHTHNGTISHTVSAKFGSARVLLKPAKSGTGIIAGGAVRSICELAGIKNITGKIQGRSSNKINVSAATLAALRSLKARRQKGVAVSTQEISVKEAPSAK